VAVAEYGKQDLINHYQVAADKIVVVPNGTRDVFQPISLDIQDQIKQQYSQGQEFFFFLGAIHPRKNLIGLIRGYEQFRTKTQAPVKLLIAGKLAWQVEDIMQIHAQSPFAKDIIFLGYVPEEIAAQLMATALALTYLSFFEGFGLPVLEALCTDTPVITANTSSLPEVAGEAALLVDPHNTGEIAAAMQRIWNEPELRADLVKKGQQQRLLFSWDEAAEKIYSLLESVVQKNQ